MISLKECNQCYTWYTDLDTMTYSTPNDVREKREHVIAHNAADSCGWCVKCRNFICCVVCRVDLDHAQNATIFIFAQFRKSYFCIRCLSNNIAPIDVVLLTMYFLFLSKFFYISLKYSGTPDYGILAFFFLAHSFVNRFC